MSDHLIAEANRHAKALTDERNNLVVEMNLLREWQREVIQNARAHHAQLTDVIARAERAEAEIKDRAAIMRDVMRERDAAEAELAAERDKVRALRLACERIVSQWDADHDTNPIGAGNVMYSRASVALAATEDTP